MIYEHWQEIVVDGKKYYFQFMARYGGKDHVIVTDEPKSNKAYYKYFCLEDIV